MDELGVCQIELEMRTDELRRVQDQLATSRSRFVELYDGAPVGYVTLDSEDGVIEANLRAAGLLGVGRKSLIGRSFSEFVHRDDEDAFSLFRRRLSVDGTHEPQELRLKRTDGELLWVRLEATTFRSDDDGEVRSHFVISDISARRHAEEELREREEVFSRIVGQAVDSIGLVDAVTGEFIEFNDAACRNLGYSRDELAGLTLGDIDLQWPGLGVVAALADLGTRNGGVFETRHRRKDGVIRDVRITASLLDVGGRTCLAGVWSDITDQKRADEALRESEQRYRVLFEDSRSVMMLVDATSGAILDANRTACAWYGWSRDELLAMNIDQINTLSPVDVRVEMASALSGKTGAFHFKHRLADGTVRDVDVYSGPLEVHGTTALYSLIHDVTDRERATAELKEHRLHMEQLVAERTEELSEANRVLARETTEVERWRQNFDAFFNTIDDLLFVLDGDGTMIHVNETVCRRLGYDEAELIGRSVLDVHPALRRDEAGRIVAAMLAGEADFCPVPVVTKSGVEIPVETRVVPGVWNGEPALFGVTKDVSALKLSEEKFSRAFHSSPVLMAISGAADGRFVDVNEVFLTTLGFARHEVLGRTSAELGVFDDSRVRDDIAAELAAGAHVRDAELDVHRADGVIVHGLFSAEPIVIGEEPCLLTTMLDVTARRKAEEAVRTSEALHRSIMSALPDGVTVTDLEGRIRMVSPAALALFGSEQPDQVVGRSPDDFIAPADRERALADLASMVREGRSGPNEYVGLRADGSTFAVEVRGEFIRDADGRATGMVFISRDISARKRADDALRHSEEQLARAVEGSGVGLWDWHVQTGEAVFNERWAQIIGYTLAELAPLSIATWTSVCHPDDLERSAALIEEHFSGRSPMYNCEARMRHKDGRWVWVLDRGTVSEWDADGRPLRMLGTHLDITERKLAEEALRESEEQLVCAVDGSGVGLWDWQVQTGEETFSERWAEIAGYTLEELAPTSIETWRQLTHPDDLQRADELLEEHFAGKSAIYAFEERVLHKDGRWIWVLDRGSVSEWDDAGLPVRMTGTALDITERKQAEEALRELTDRLSLATRAGGVGVWDWDLESGTLTWDEQMLALYGTTREQFSGAYEAWQAGLHPDDRARVDAEIQKALRGEKEFDTEFRVLWPDGSGHTIRALAIVQRDAAGTPLRMIGTNWDITTGKLAEQRLHEANRKLEESVAQARELAVQAQAATTAKSVFLAHMSHEIRTPLNAIIGFAQLLQGDPEVTAKQKDRVSIIGRSGEHLLALLSDVLELSKVESGRQRLDETAFDLHRLLEDLTTVFRARAEVSGLAFTVDGLDRVPQFVKADRAKLRQILTNLLGNAVRLTESGGVCLRASTSRLVAGRPLLVVSVDDTGPGIAVGEMEALFAPFEQTSSGRRQGSGTGLGLAISRQFASLMGGELDVVSEVGRGSTFRLAVPFEEADKPAETAEGDASRVLRLEAGQPSCGVLVADGDDDGRALLLELLGDVGFDMAEAVDGLEARAALAKWRPRVVIVADSLPDTSAAEAVRSIRRSEAGAAARVVVLAAGATDESRDLALAAGADAYIAKPFRAAALLEQIGLLTGLRYVRTGSATAASDVTAPEAALTAEMLRSLPGPLQDQIRAAAVRARHGRLLELADDVTVADPEAGARFRDTIAVFDYACILRLLGEEPG